MAVIKRTHVLGCAASAALAALLTLVCLAILDGGSRANKWISLTDYMYDDLFPGETQALSPEAFVSRLKGRPGYEGLPIEVAAVQIAELDTDGDGKLSPSEGSGQGLAIIGHWDAMKDRYWIEDADADEDGKLTSEELCASNDYGDPAITPELMAQAIAAVDADGDGVLSGSELDAFRSEHDKVHAPLNKFLHARFDADGDGAWTQAEFCAFTVHHYGEPGDEGYEYAPKCSELPASPILDEDGYPPEGMFYPSCDKDGDGKLSLAEFAALKKLDFGLSDEGIVETCELKGGLLAP